MAIQVRELHHHAIKVPPAQAGAVQEFYETVFGFEADDHRPVIPEVPGAWLYVGAEGATQIHIVGVEGEFSPMMKGPGQDPARFHVALAVDDIEQARAELDRLDVKYWVLGDLIPGRQFIFIDDPAGNMIELHQYGSCTCNRSAP